MPSSARQHQEWPSHTWPSRSSLLPARARLRASPQAAVNARFEYSDSAHFDVDADVPAQPTASYGREERCTRPSSENASTFRRLPLPSIGAFLSFFFLLSPSSSPCHATASRVEREEAMPDKVRAQRLHRAGCPFRLDCGQCLWATGTPRSLGICLEARRERCNHRGFAVSPRGRRRGACVHSGGRPQAGIWVWEDRCETLSVAAGCLPGWLRSDESSDSLCRGHRARCAQDSAPTHGSGKCQCAPGASDRDWLTGGGALFVAGGYVFGRCREERQRRQARRRSRRR